MGEAIAEAFRQNARDYVHENGLVPQDYSMRMAIHHSGGTHLWTSCPLIPLTDWMRDRERSREWLDRLVKELNSAEDLDAAGGEFFAELLFVKNRSRGAGNGKKYDLRGMSYETMLKKKKSVVTIKNKDQLCCARAIITMKAKADQDPQYHNILQGCWRQRHLAKTLHKDAEVPEGSSGLEELKKFQRCLGPEYQLMVIEGMKGKIIFREREFDQAPKTITLLKIENHYHSITSIPGFLNRSNFCRHCEKAYNTEDAYNHNCLGQNCPACLRQNKTCPNFATWVTPEVHCDACGQNFYGRECYEAHLQKPRSRKSVCERFKKCPECCKVCEVERRKKHICFQAKCRNCGEVKDVNHDCYIQSYVPKERNPLKVTEENGEESLSEDDDDESPEPLEPLICTADLECTTDENRTFKTARAGWSYLSEDSYHEKATVKEVLEDAFAKTMFDGQERKVFVYAHNMRGFDGTFFQEGLYDMGFSIDKILNQGAKALSFECGNLIFRDSLNFFSMSLEKLPATFNLSELQKRFFPYSWTKPEKYSYVGSYPPAEDYHPERMTLKRRKEFLTWHKEKVESGAVFDVEKELSAYLKSDVYVLKGALTKFSEEMKDLTAINPLIECVTIASCASLVWRKMFLDENLIALFSREARKKKKLS